MKNIVALHVLLLYYHFMLVDGLV